MSVQFSLVRLRRSVPAFTIANCLNIYCKIIVYCKIIIVVRSVVTCLCHRPILQQVEVELRKEVKKSDLSETLDYYMKSASSQPNYHREASL